MRRRFALLLFSLALSGCGADSAEEAGERLRARSTAADPAVTSAIDDPIMTDEGLANQDMSRLIRATPGPVEVTYPAPDAVPSQGQYRQEEARTAEACTDLEPASKWPGRLSPAFPPYPGARLIEAAANEKPGCRIQYVAFAANAAPSAVAAHYRSRAKLAGFSTEERSRIGDVILSGTHPSLGSYYLIATPKGSGSEAALRVDGGSGSGP